LYRTATITVKYGTAAGYLIPPQL